MLRVAVLCGGRSGEHEVSLRSAESIIEGLDRAKYEVLRIVIDQQGRWSPRAISPEPGANPGIDVVFPVLHGTFGEDGTVQGLLELAGLPYVGAGVLASAVSMDKEVMKRLLLERGLPVTEYVTVMRGHYDLDEICARLPFPMFVKPANLGSSVGISKAKCREGLKAAIALAGEYDCKIIVERGIAGREFECSVLGNQDPIAVACYQAVDCEGMARVDFLMESATGKIYINEINTIPGFTSISMYPKMWEAAGVPFGELLDRLIGLALERHRTRQATRYSRHA
jgi:D-alanine-D-alanine ligase